MTNNRQYYIYLRSIKKRVPCTKEEFDAYYHDVDVYRIKQQRHGNCSCPPKQRLACDMDCLTCPYHTVTDASMDYWFTDELGEPHDYYESTPDPSPLISDIVSDAEEIGHLINRLNELLPGALEIGELRLEGLSNTEIARRQGISRQTYEHRVKRAKEILKKEFSKFF